MKEELMQRELMTRYVLGELSEAEQEHIEETYFTDPAFLQDLLAARNDLIDAFVQGKLNSSEHGRFENRLRSSPRLVERVEFARALFRAVDSVNAKGRGGGNPDAKQTKASHRPMGQGLPFRLTLSIRPQWGLAAASLLLLAGVFWVATQPREKQVAPLPTDQIATASPQAAQSLTAGGVEQSGKTQAASHPYPTRNHGIVDTRSKSSNVMTRPSPPAKIAASITSFFLPFGASRANDDLRELVIPIQADMVSLQLEIEERDGHYQAVMQTERGEKIWIKENLASRQLRSSRVVVCDIPTLLLENKNYVLRLRPRQPTSAPTGAFDIDYSFKVTKR